MDKESIPPVCATIGNFDGVHKGHAALIREALEIAREKELNFLLITFNPHPREILKGENEHSPLTSRDEKARLLRELGVKNILELPFTREIAALSAEEFVVSKLLPLNLRHLVMGHDFSLGKNRQGSRLVLDSLGQKYGFATTQIPALEIDGQIASSTRLRSLIKDGEMTKAAHILGRFFSISGNVARGYARGRTIGYPTANLENVTTLVPKRGVYAVFASWDNRRVPAITNIGANPTFSGDRETIETFFLNDSADVYGKNLSLEFVRRIRPERRFDGADALTRQIADDVARAAEILNHAMSS